MSRDISIVLMGFIRSHILLFKKINLSSQSRKITLLLFLLLLLLLLIDRQMDKIYSKLLDTLSNCLAELISLVTFKTSSVAAAVKKVMARTPLNAWISAVNHLSGQTLIIFCKMTH